MKKKIIITIVTLLILVPSCFFAYKHFTKEEPAKTTPSTPSEEETPPVTEENKGVYSNRLPRLDASLATQPLMDAFVGYFANNDAVENIQEDYTNTHPAYVKLINNETDLIIVTEPSEEELALAESSGVELEVTKVVNEGFVFFVNSKNPVDNLKLSEIVEIYSGKTTNWQDLGGKDEEIIAYQRPVNSGSQTGMLSLVMKGVPMKEPTTEEAVATMGGIIDIVADYDNNIAGIGYSYYYYANSMYNTPNIKFLAIDNIKPNYNTIQNGTYPLMTAYYIVTRKNPTDNVANFKKLLLSSEGAQVAKEAGYVPIK